MLVVKLSLAVLTCLLAIFAIVCEILSNDLDKATYKRLAKAGMFGAVGFGVLAVSVTAIDAMRGPSGKATAVKPRAFDGAVKSSAAVKPPVSTPTGNVAAQTAPVNYSARVTTPSFSNMGGNQAAPPPSALLSSQSSPSNYRWDDPGTAPTVHDHDRDHDDAARPPKVVMPYTPVTFTAVLRFSSDDPAIKSYVDRVVRQAEKASGISLSSSGDKFASLRITPSEEIVYADGKQARLEKAKLYAADRAEKSASSYLFGPHIHVTVSASNGTRAVFTRRVPWSSVDPEKASDLLDVYVFPRRHRVVLTVTANCQPEQGQFPDGAPSVYDLRGGTVALQLLRDGDNPPPQLLELDEVDLHAGPESEALGASMAPRIHPTILSILCATTPAGRVELGIDDATLQRSSVDRDSVEICGPVALAGFPSSPPH